MRLRQVYDGWEGYNRSLVSAINNLTPEQLLLRPTPELPSAAMIAWHIASGRVDWFERIAPEHFSPLRIEINALIEEPQTKEVLVYWLNRTWSAVETTLARWTTDDLAFTYEQEYQGKVYAVSRQWVIWRMLTHDIHHGGQLSELLLMHGIEPVELTLLGGHLTEPPVVR